jgi:hypothetical protein
MAWHNKFPLSLTAVTLAATTLVAGCNVGKTDTVTAAGTTTSTSGTTTSTAGGKGCTGSFIGNIEPPSHEVRIENRNRQLIESGVGITGNDAIDNVATTGGGVDGGIYLEGAFRFQTDANCNVINSEGSQIFGIPITIEGKVNADRTFNMFSPQAGPFVGSVDANNHVTGQQQEGGKEWVHGVLNGTFVANGKI